MDDFFVLTEYHSNIRPPNIVHGNREKKNIFQ